MRFASFPEMNRPCDLQGLLLVTMDLPLMFEWHLRSLNTLEDG